MKFYTLCIAGALLFSISHTPLQAQKKNKYALSDLHQPVNSRKTEREIVYDFSVERREYRALSNPIPLNQLQQWDDPIYHIPIGFSFEFFEVRYDSLFVSDYVFFEEDTLGNQNWIDAFYADFIDRGIQLSESPINLALSGNEGSRILKLEWSNAGFSCQSDSVSRGNDFVNVQLWLYEGINLIEIHLGALSVSEPISAYCEEEGAFVGLWKGIDGDEYFYLEGTPNNPQLYTEGSASLAGTPEPGTVYRFFPTVSTRIPTLLDESAWNVYPNPSAEQIQLTLTAPLQSSLQLQIYDLHGKLWLEQRGILRGMTSVTLATLPKGIYLLVVQNQEVIGRKKLIKI